MGKKSHSKMSTNPIRYGTVVSFGDNHLEVVLDVYDETVFHTLNSDGVVMQYNMSDIDRTWGELDIKSEIGSICSKLRNFQRDSGIEAKTETDSKRHVLDKFKVSNMLSYQLALVVGAAHSGKTTLVNHLIRETKDEYKHFVIGWDTNENTLIHYLKKIVDEQKDQKRKEGKANPIIVAIDGVTHTTLEKPEVINFILTGKSYNIRFWITTQSLLYTPSWIKAHADLFFLFNAHSEEKKRYRDLWASSPREWDRYFEIATSEPHSVCVYDPHVETGTKIKKLTFD